jgi:uncharacterized protein YjbI with pentapeptide repeats
MEAEPAHGAGRSPVEPREVSQAELDALLTQQEGFVKNRRTTPRPHLNNLLIKKLTIPNGVRFDDADLSGTIFEDTLVSGCTFQNAKLNGTTFSNLVACKFYRCEMTGVHFLNPADCSFQSLSFANCKIHEPSFVRCSFAHVDFGQAILEYVEFGARSGVRENTVRSWLRSVFRWLRPDRCTFDSCKFAGVASMHYVDFHGARLTNCNLQDVDFRRCERFRFDLSDIKGIRIPYHSNDPWSVVTRNYTGTKMLFNLGFLAVFFIPYLAKGAALILLSNMEPRLAGLMSELNAKSSAIGIGSQEFNFEAMCAKLACVEKPVWQVMLGPDASRTLLAAAIALLFYNVARGVLTWRISPMKEEQDATSITPPYLPPDVGFRDPWKDAKIDHFKYASRSLWAYSKNLFSTYAPFWRVHQVITLAFYFTVVLTVLHLISFFRQEVQIPQSLLH